MLATVLKLRPGSIVHARSIDGYAMADKQLNSTVVAYALSHSMLAPEQSLSEASLGSVPGTELGIHVDGGAALIWPPAEPSPLAAVDLPGESVSGQFLGPGPSPFKETPPMFELQSYFGISSCSTGEEILCLRQEEKVA